MVEDVAPLFAYQQCDIIDYNCDYNKLYIIRMYCNYDKVKYAITDYEYDYTGNTLNYCLRDSARRLCFAPRPCVRPSACYQLISGIVNPIMVKLCTLTPWTAIPNLCLTFFT